MLSTSSPTNLSAPTCYEVVDTIRTERDDNKIIEMKKNECEIRFSLVLYLCDVSLVNLMIKVLWEVRPSMRSNESSHQ